MFDAEFLDGFYPASAPVTDIFPESPDQLEHDQFSQPRRGCAQRHAELFLFALVD
jgi:hypothetical protein